MHQRRDGVPSRRRLLPAGRPVRARSAAVVAIVATLAVGAGTSNAGTAPRPAPRDAQVVVAVIESSLNPYHDEFARPGLTRHPSSYIAGYPKTAKPLRLSLGASDYDKAATADDALWRGLPARELLYVPSTNFAGLVYLPTDSPLDGDTSVSVGTEGVGDNSRPVINGQQFHGTGVSSVLAGSRYGACPDCLVVFVAADDAEEGFAWAAAQPWIDVISNSWGGPLGVPSRGDAARPEQAADPSAEFTRKAAEQGKVVLFGSGNGATGLGGIVPSPAQHSETYSSPFTGPPWILTVGAAKANGQPTNWHDIPVDVIAQGEARPAASPGSIQDQQFFLGTSCATPIAAGVIGQALLNARRAVADTGTGPRRGSLVVPAPGTRKIGRGPLADANLGRAELVDAALSVAAWQPFDPGSLVTDPLVTPTTSLSYAYQGHGRLDRDTIPLLTNVLLGKAPQPPRPEMAEWAAGHQQRRTALWGSAPR
jgi:hypothetical protein